MKTAPRATPAGLQAGPPRQRPLKALGLSTPLALVTAAACLANLLVPGLLSGPAVMNGSARGTSLVALAVATALGVLTWRGRRVTLRTLTAIAGLTAYLLYNSVMFVFATPFNPAFPLYVAMLGLSAWTTVWLAATLWDLVDELAVPVPWWVPVSMWVVVGLNASAWLARVVPAVLDDEPTAWLQGTGLTTNPVVAQDLAIWLPLMAWLGWGVWRSRPQQVALAAAGLVFWVVEFLGVAVDQWWGHAADPGSSWASAGAVVMFAALAVAGLLPADRLLRAVPITDVRDHLDERSRGGRHEHR